MNAKVQAAGAAGAASILIVFVAGQFGLDVPRSRRGGYRDSAGVRRRLPTEGEDLMYTATQTSVEDIARVCHEANRAWCEANGDHSQPSWDDAPEWQRSSALAGVKGALNGNTPEQSHEGWSALKTSEGWVYGEAKDPDAKTHPCLVPYDELPPAQRLKDGLFVAIVSTLSRTSAGF